MSEREKLVGGKRTFQPNPIPVPGRRLPTTPTPPPPQPSFFSFILFLFTFSLPSFPRPPLLSQSQCKHCRYCFFLFFKFSFLLILLHFFSFFFYSLPFSHSLFFVFLPFSLTAPKTTQALLLCLRVLQLLVRILVLPLQLKRTSITATLLCTSCSKKEMQLLLLQQ